MKKPKVGNGSIVEVLDILRKKAKKDEQGLIFHGDPKKVKGVGAYTVVKLKKQKLIESVGRAKWKIVEQSAPAETPVNTAEGAANDDGTGVPTDREIQLFKEFLVADDGGPKSPEEIKTAQALLQRLIDRGTDMLKAHEILSRVSKYAPLKET